MNCEHKWSALTYNGPEEKVCVLCAASQSEAMIEQLKKEIAALKEEREALPKWVGPCAHGRDPWDRCDICGEGRMEWALFAAWESVTRERDEARAMFQQKAYPSESCMTEREMGNGGCGACSLCYFEERAKAEKLRLALEKVLPYLLPADYSHVEHDYDSVSSFEHVEEERRATVAAHTVLKETE